MPSLWMPRIGFGSITRPSGIAVPGVASGTMSPACHVERAAPHVPLAAVAGVDVDAVHLGRVGMPLGAHDPGGDDTVDGRADVDDLVDRQTEVGHGRRRSCRRRRRPGRAR